MSASVALQNAVINALRSDIGVVALIGLRSYDVPPAKPVYPYISLGPSTVQTGRHDGFRSRVETLQVDAWAENQRRRQPIKALSDAIIEALDQVNLTLSGDYGLARMDLVLARILDDPDGITKHAVLQFECEVVGPVTL